MDTPTYLVINNVDTQIYPHAWPRPFSKGDKTTWLGTGYIVDFVEMPLLQVTRMGSTVNTIEKVRIHLIPA